MDRDETNLNKLDSFCWNVCFSLEQAAQFEKNLRAFHHPIKCHEIKEPSIGQLGCSY